MNAFRSVVVGVDFTPCSTAAVRQAVRVAEWSQAEVHPVHVLETLVVVDLEEALGPFQPDVRGELVRDARRSWQALAAAIPGASELDIEVEIDSPLVAILRQVRRHSAGLLVLGTHGTSPPDRGAGTLATACLRKAMSEVLLVREPQTGPFTAVVACVDFSATARRALGRAVQVAAQDRATLFVLHVFQGPWHRLHSWAPTPQASPDYQKQYQDALRRRLDAFCGPFQREMAALKVECAVVDHPSHGRGIAEFVTQAGIDLVVLGTRGRTNLRDLLLGSTAERVVRDAPCSILAVKPEGFEHPLGG